MEEHENPADCSANHRDHCCSHEEAKRLADGVDEFYFGQADRVPMPDADDHIGRFTYFKAHQWGVSVAEAGKRSIAQLFERFQAGTSPVVVLTAFRTELALPQNRLSNASIAADIRDLGWGYARVKGTFVEMTKDDNGKEQPVRNSEESIFGFSGLGRRKLAPVVTKLMEKYRQEAALIMLPKPQEALVLSSDGSTFSLGPWPATVEQMATYYARMRSGPRDRAFTFDAVGNDSVMSRWAVDVFFKNK